MVSPPLATPPREKEPEPTKTDVPIKEPVPIIRVKPIQPIQSVAVKQPKPVSIGGDNPGKTIPETPPKQFVEEFPKNSPNNSETIPTPELFRPSEPRPQANIEPYKKKGKPGRQRKYEETGNHGEIPVKEVVLFRHIKGRHWPGMSQDMREWYEFYYFTKPKRTEKAKDAEDYTRHCKSWERGQRWIADHEGRAYVPEALGHSGKVVAYRKRATS